MVLVVCENEIQESCFFVSVSSEELWQRCISLSVGFHFLLVKCVLTPVWCRPYLAAHFGFFNLWTFLWSLSQVQESTFYPFTPKVGSKCTYFILTSSSVKPSNVWWFLVQTCSPWRRLVLSNRNIGHEIYPFQSPGPSAFRMVLID